METTEKVSGVTVCPLCGRKFPCGATAGKDTCWCYYFPVVNDRPLKEKDIRECVCPVCLRNMAINQGFAEDRLPDITFTETEWEKAKKADEDEEKTDASKKHVV